MKSFRQRTGSGCDESSNEKVTNIIVTFEKLLKSNKWKVAFYFVTFEMLRFETLRDESDWESCWFGDCWECGGLRPVYMRRKDAK